jgi:molybdenum cofactor guanylyltransferase
MTGKKRDIGFFVEIFFNHLKEGVWMEAGAIILSGGKSSRMGTNKALLKINEKTNIERIVAQLKRIFDDIILVTNDPETYGFLNVRITSDHYPGKGPLAGLHAGLVASRFEKNLIVACDMPFISADLASVLVNHVENYDAVIPVINGRKHPLFSVFKKNTITRIEESIGNDDLRMQGFLDYLHVLYMTEKDLTEYSEDSLGRIFYNMNNLDEYETAKIWAKHQEGM